MTALERGWVAIRREAALPKRHLEVGENMDI